MHRTVLRSLRRLLVVVVATALSLTLCAVSLSEPAHAGAPATASADFFATDSAPPSTRVLFALGLVIALFGVAAVVLGVRRGRRRR